MQQIGQHLAVRHGGRRHCYRMYRALLRIDTNMRLPSQVALVALLRLVHLRIALFLRVFSRRWRMEDRRIPSSELGRAGRNPDPLRLQMQVHCLQHHAAQIMPFKQMSKATRRRFVRRRSRVQVHPDEPLSPEKQK
jgi:hypothetical protein